MAKVDIDHYCRVYDDFLAPELCDAYIDMYEATYEALKKVAGKVVKNGIIMCEDPVNTPMLYGALYAMEKFLKSEDGKDFVKIFKKNHYFLIKQN